MEAQVTSLGHQAQVMDQAQAHRVPLVQATALARQAPAILHVPQGQVPSAAVSARPRLLLNPAPAKRGQHVLAKKKKNLSCAGASSLKKKRRTRARPRAVRTAHLEAMVAKKN